MTIRRSRPLRALAVKERARAAAAADLAARALASIEAEISGVAGEKAGLSATDLAPTAGRAALLEAAALDRAARRARSRELADRLTRLESDREAARRALDSANEALAKAIRKVELLGDGAR